MHSRAAQPAGRETLTRARRQAVATLRLIENLSGYCAGQLVGGLGPAESRLALLEVSAELVTLAEVLRRLALGRLDVSARRDLAAELAASGLSHRQIAAMTGVAKRTTWADLRARQ